jgi:serine/threonine protein kinase
MSANSYRGQRIAQFAIQRCLLNLSHMSVYDAVDLVANRKVIVYLSAEPIAEERFTAARLQPPYNPVLLGILGREQSEDCALLVMEPFESMSLEDRLRAGPLPLISAATITMGIARGLDNLHERGQYLGVLRPSMILVDSKDRVKILDISSVISSDSKASYVATPADILDSLPYASPEILTGNSVDAQSDQFTFATIVCAMFGVCPFRVSSPIEAMIQIGFEDLDAAQLRRLPVSLATALIRSFSRSPGNRFVTCVELASAVETASQLQTDSPAPPAVKSSGPRSQNLPAHYAPPAKLSEPKPIRPANYPPEQAKRPKKVLWVAGLAFMAVVISAGYFVLNNRRTPVVASPSLQTPGSAASDQELLRALQPSDTPDAKAPTHPAGPSENDIGAADGAVSRPLSDEPDTPQKPAPSVTSATRNPAATPRKEKAATIEVKPIEPTVVSPQ